MIRNALIKIISEYPDAIKEPIKNHNLVKFIEKTAVEIIKSNLPEKFKSFKVKGSAGEGRWIGTGKSERNPWIAVLNENITSGASKGYYTTYSFIHKSDFIILSVAQSDHEMKSKYSDNKIPKVLNNYADLMRLQLNSKKYSKFDSGIPEVLDKNGDKLFLNRIGAVYHKKYNINELPSDKELKEDLSLMLEAYWDIYKNGGRPGLENEIIQNNEFDPNNIDSEKEKVLRSVTYRRGQKKFRDNLLRAYDSECVMSGCREEEVLQAAHILPYTDAETNKIDNGLLLRADLHNLFD